MPHVPRIYCPGRLAPGPLALDGDAARRLAAVLRVQPGEAFRVFAGDGREWAATVLSATRSAVRVQVGELTRQEPAPPRVVELWCGLVRANRFDWALEKCTEAGADIIRPLLSEHSARGDAPSADKQARWQRISVEASEQCGRLYLPVIEPPARLADLAVRLRHPLILCDASGMPWAEAARLLPPSGRVAVAIGPEGGFSPAELEAARQAGALVTRLGPNILRTETAALAATVLLRAG